MNLKPNCVDPILGAPCAFCKGCCAEFSCPDLPRFNGDSLLEGCTSCGGIVAGLIKKMGMAIPHIMDSIIKVPWFLLGCFLLILLFYSIELYQGGVSFNEKIQLIMTKNKILP